MRCCRSSEEKVLVNARFRPVERTSSMRFRIERPIVFPHLQLVIVWTSVVADRRRSAAPRAPRSPPRKTPVPLNGTGMPIFSPVIPTLDRHASVMSIS